MNHSVGLSDCFSKQPTGGSSNPQAPSLGWCWRVPQSPVSIIKYAVPCVGQRICRLRSSAGQHPLYFTAGTVHPSVSRDCQSIHFFPQKPSSNTSYLLQSCVQSFIHSSMALQPSIGLWGLFFSFTIFFYTDGRTPWTGDQPVARPLPTHRTT
jgi:hypothetical protein